MYFRERHELACQLEQLLKVALWVQHRVVKQVCKVGKCGAGSLQKPKRRHIAGAKLDHVFAGLPVVAIGAGIRGLILGRRCFSPPWLQDLIPCMGSSFRVHCIDR